MSSEERVKEEIHLFLKETARIFDLVKKYSILIEEKLPGHKAPIHAANELKSLIFHLYNSVSIPAHIDTNILEAREHLCRAFYDLHNVVVSIYIEDIKNILKGYKIKTIANAFPDYGSTIRPAIRNIQEQLREIRATRNTDVTLLDDDINVFSEQVAAIARFDDIVESMKPELNQYETEEKRKNIKEKAWDVAKILLAASVGAAITFFITAKAKA